MTDTVNTLGLLPNNPTADGGDPQPAFTVFPKLPIELRLKIFGIAAREPRIIEVSYSAEKARVYQVTLTPPLLRTSSESRREALRTMSPIWEEKGSQDMQTLMNLERDILYVVYETYSVRKYPLISLEEFANKVAG